MPYCVRQVLDFILPKHLITYPTSTFIIRTAFPYQYLILYLLRTKVFCMFLSVSRVSLLSGFLFLYKYSTALVTVASFNILILSTTNYSSPRLLCFPVEFQMNFGSILSSFYKILVEMFIAIEL